MLIRSVAHRARSGSPLHLPTPNPAQTKLINEKYRAPLNGLTIDKAIKNHIVSGADCPGERGRVLAS
ncbi:phage tail protein [Serratia proteamaculans]|uniref:phage tail-collar fiber domain-containing protein n=1 Tax=Serratia proteamaculans TaxID=28151 RepID=UPI0037038A56